MLLVALAISDDDDFGDSCRLYMATSSIPNAGLGMYTTIPFAKGDPIFFPEIIIQHVDHEWNAQLRREHAAQERALAARESQARKKQVWKKYLMQEEVEWLLYMYFWESRVTMGKWDAEDSVISMVPGIGMLANSHTGLVSALMRRPQIDGAGLHRARDPGAGAVSQYFGYRYHAVYDIPAGMELFAEYGDDWFADRQDVFGLLPLSDDFKKADNTISAFLQDLSEDVMADDDLLNAAWTQVKTQALDQWEKEHGDKSKRSRLENALPEHGTDVQGVKDGGGTAMRSVPNVIRSDEWLEEHGLCLDNIRSGPSTLPQAGRGAFATRHLKKDQVIAPAPLVQIARKHLEIYNVDHTFKGHQLLLNYCYGHPTDSSLLLFPYASSVNYINHQLSNNTDNDSGPNAYIRWTRNPHFVPHHHHGEWLEVTVPELLRDEPYQHAGLIMEFVAVRDIQKGEEVTIDYGSHWQKAWDKHMAEWKPHEDNIHYRAASDLNDYKSPGSHGSEFAILEPRIEKQIPDNLFLICYAPEHLEMEDKPIYQKDFGRGENEWVWRWRTEKGLLDHIDRTSVCVILSREETPNEEDNNGNNDTNKEEWDKYTYTVRIEYDNDDFNPDDDDTDEESIYMVVTGVPRYAMEFADHAYTKDEHLPNTFRHSLGLPENMVPPAWRDLNSKYDDVNGNHNEKDPRNGDGSIGEEEGYGDYKFDTDYDRHGKDDDYLKRRGEEL